VVDEHGAELVAIAEMLRDRPYRKIEGKYFPFDMYVK
jgi:hypothetical protein